MTLLKYNTLVNLGTFSKPEADAIVHDTYLFGMRNSECKPNCVTWIYEPELDDFSHKRNVWLLTADHSSFKSKPMQHSMFISDVHAITPFNNTHKHVCNVKIDNSEVTVQEEYKVYDFNGILATVGGSLGLFVGFSFLDCMLFTLKNIKKYC